MNWSNITERNWDYEERTGFCPDIDYRAEIDRFNELLKGNDEEGAVKILYKHGGRISLFGKMIYQEELKKAGLI